MLLRWEIKIDCRVQADTNKQSMPFHNLLNGHTISDLQADTNKQSMPFHNLLNGHTISDLRGLVKVTINVWLHTTGLVQLGCMYNICTCVCPVTHEGPGSQPALYAIIGHYSLTSDPQFMNFAPHSTGDMLY